VTLYNQTNMTELEHTTTVRVPTQYWNY